jgi:hypothetical protein
MRFQLTVVKNLPEIPEGHIEKIGVSWLFDVWKVLRVRLPPQKRLKSALKSVKEGKLVLDLYGCCRGKKDTAIKDEFFKG